MDNIIVYIISTLKTLFPSFIGSCIAVWYKRDEFSFTGLTLFQKLTLCMFILLLLSVGLSIGYYLGSAIAQIAGIINPSYSAFCIQMIVAATSFKITDNLMKNSDVLLGTIFNGLNSVIKSFFDKFKG